MMYEQVLEEIANFDFDEKVKENLHEARECQRLRDAYFQRKKQASEAGEEFDETEPAHGSTYWYKDALKEIQRIARCAIEEGT